MGRAAYRRRGGMAYRSSPRPNKKENNTLWPCFYAIGPVAQQNPVLLTPGFRHHSLLRDWTCIKGATERIVLKEKYAPSKLGGGRQTQRSRKKK